MTTFSQRMGIKPISEVVQLESMDEELRNGLWNALDRILFKTSHFDESRFTENLWWHFFKKPVDSRPIEHNGFGVTYQKVWQEIRGHFFGCEWNEVYDFVEFTLRCYPGDLGLSKGIERTLARENSGYRVISGQFVPISDVEEVAEVTAAIEAGYTPVREHLRTSLSLLTDRKNPDYRNSIKEAISAVESMAKIVSGKDKATLEDALKVLEKDGALHPALKSSFSKMYAYTNDANGIRHALSESHDLTQADARYFLIVCSALTNLLKVKAAKSCS